jgi:hypothetical protein
MAKKQTKKYRPPMRKIFKSDLFEITYGQIPTKGVPVIRMKVKEPFEKSSIDIPVEGRPALIADELTAIAALIRIKVPKTKGE